LVQVQDALTSLAEGELARIEAEVAAEPQAALEQARTGIRQAARALEDLDKQLTEQVALSNRCTGPRLLSGDELSRCRTSAFRARLPHRALLCSRSDDRVAAVSTVEQLNRTLRQLRSDDPLVAGLSRDLPSVVGSPHGRARSDRSVE
jgi:hypothetical protein